MLLLVGGILVWMGLLALVLRPMILSGVRGLSSLGGWMVVLFPVALPVLLVVKDSGPIFWHTLSGPLVHEWLGSALVAIYVALAPVRGAFLLGARLRDERTAFERMRRIPCDTIAELEYQKLADLIGVDAVPVFASPDVPRGQAYAMGFFKTRRLVVSYRDVPKRYLADEDFWDLDAEDEWPESFEDLRPILAHELAHHRDRVGLRGLLIEASFFLLPIEMLSQERWRRPVDGIGVWLLRAWRKAGRWIWGHAIGAERLRQEWVADGAASAALRGDVSAFLRIRGFVFSVGGRSRPMLGGLCGVAAVGLLGAGAILLPGRTAWPTLFGKDSGIAWSLPRGWRVLDLTIDHPLRTLAYFPPRDGKPGRIKVHVAPAPSGQSALSSLGAVGWTSEPCSALKVTWPFRFRGGRQIPEGTRLIGAKVDRYPDPLVWEEVVLDGRPRVSRIEGDRYLATTTFKCPLGGQGEMLWSFGFQFYSLFAGEYELEPPEIELVTLPNE